MPVGASAREQAAHIPKWVNAQLQSPTGAVSVEAREATVLLIDIAGFTAKTDSAAGDGAEGLTNFINDCFAVLTDIIVAHGGDIVAFAGDAILAVWADGDAAGTVGQAARCGIALKKAMAGWRYEGGISARIAVETGELFFCKLGGWRNVWHYVAAGEPFYSVGAAYRRADVNDIALCTKAAALLSGSAETEQTPYGARLLRLRSDQRQFEPAVPVQAETSASEPHSVDTDAWVGEFRALTLARIGLADFKFDSGFQARLQDFVLEIQQIAERLEGTIHQVLMDDKGLTLALAFGLAPFAHEDDPLRAVEACLRIQRQLQTKLIPISAGISTGRLFCSNYGGRHQKTFGIFGSAINVAAHLAEAAQGDIVCDVTTAQAVGRRMAFTLLPHFRIKGSGASMLAFSPVVAGDASSINPKHGIINRHNERGALRRCLEAISAGSGTLVLVSGEAGIGKSHLLEDFVASAQMQGHAVLFSSGTAIEKSTPYFAWRAILKQLLKFETLSDGPRIQRELSQSLSGHPALLSWLPLLEEIISLGLSPSGFTDQIVGSARASAIEELAVFLLRQSAFRVLVLEDLHWFDGSSMDLLGAVTRRLPEFLIVVAQRTGANAPSKDDLDTALVPSLQLPLDRLSRNDITALISQRLRSPEIPETLTRYVYGHASGNPFFSDELVLALRDTGKVQVLRGVSSFEEPRFSDVGISPSSSVERAIVSRIDLLSPDDQLVLKAASVIGDSFTAEMLEYVVATLSRVAVERSVRRLIEQDFVQDDRETPPASFAFRHSITMDVAYNLLSFAQRRTLHQRIAEFIELHHASELQPYFARLARHLELGNEPLRALAYLELVAQQSRNNTANREAIRYVEKLFDLTQREAIAIGNSRKAAWEIIFGDAYHELSDYDSSAVHYERAMQLLGHRLPANRAERVSALVRNAATQLNLRLFTAGQSRPTEQDRADMQRVAHIHEFLSEQYFYQNDALAVLNGTLASLNLAEKCGATSETIRGYSALALGMGMSGLVRIARSYGARAIRLAQDHGSLPEIARVQLVLGVLAYGLAEWDSAEAHGAQARLLYERLGDRKRAQNSETMSIFIELLRGNIARADQRLASLFSELSDDSPLQIRAWGLSARARIGITTGTSDAGSLHELGIMARRRLLRTEQLLCIGVAAAGYLELGKSSMALELADHGLAILQECGVVWGGYVFGAAGIADVFLTQCERASGEVSSDIEAKAKLACRQLSRLARTSPICRPYNFLMNGRLSLLAGKTTHALDQWKRGARAAELLQMPHEQAQAIYRIGNASGEADPGRVSRLEQAASIFRRLGAVKELAELERSHPFITTQRGQT